jgi:hypothetical protein
MESVTRFIIYELKLKVNEKKSAVARPQERKFLGFSFTAGPEAKRVIALKALDRIREITIRAKGVSMKTTIEELAPYMRGWRGYFGFCEIPEVLLALTCWVRLRLRAAMWRQWKTPRRRRAALIELGGAVWQVIQLQRTRPLVSRKGESPFCWAFNAYFKSVSLHWSRSNSATSRTAVYGPVRTVVWQGSAGNRWPLCRSDGLCVSYHLRTNQTTYTTVARRQCWASRQCQVARI